MKRVTRVEAKGKRGEVIRVIIYCRVSTDDQEDNGTSLDTQALECRLWAEQQGYFVVDVVKETYSGACLEERKLFMDVMKRCKSGEADAIIFRTYDRLTRSVAHFYVILSDANRNGFELLCVKESFDPKNILEVILRTLVIQFAEFERYKTTERTQLGRKTKARQGKLLRTRRPYYGVRYVAILDGDEKPETVKKEIKLETAKIEVKLEIVEDEVKVIHMIDDLYLEGYGQERIALLLTDKGIPSPENKPIWCQATVGKILNNTAYHGVKYEYMTEAVISENGRRKATVRPIEDQIKMPTEIYPIIRDYETYVKIQERRALAHQTTNLRRIPENVLLRGIIRCGICNGLMTPAIKTTHNGKDVLVYRCIHYNTSNVNAVRHSLTIYSNSIEQPVIDYVKGILKNINDVETKLLEYIRTHSAQDTIESYELAIEEIKSEQAQTIEDMKGVRGKARELMVAQLNALEDQIDKLEREKENVMSSGGKWEKIKRDIGDLLAFLRTGNIKLDELSVEEKNKHLRTLGVRVAVDKPTERNRCNYNIKITFPGMSSSATFRQDRIGCL